MAEDLDLRVNMNGVMPEFALRCKLTDQGFGEAYRHEYSCKQPHSSICYKSPVEF